MKDLLLLLCRYPFEKKSRETLSILVKDVKDWNQAVQLINAHGIIALAAYNIKEAGLENEIPQEAMAFLENGYRQNVIRNIWLTERWKEVNAILENAGIKHILLKGMALEHTIYGSRGLRQMNDNDILVKKREAAEAWHLLQKEGFTYKTPKSSLHLKIMLDISHHLPTLFKEGYSIEIHTHLFDYNSNNELLFGDPFENPLQIDISGNSAMTLQKEINLNYLINHWKRHAIGGESQIRSYADIVLLGDNRSEDFNDNFINIPDQKKLRKFRKAAYKTTIKYMHPKYRLVYILGDLFPSVKWMRERYKCNRLIVLLYYLQRLGKLFWIV